MTRDLWLVILGAVLAFGGGLAAFFIQWWWNRRVQRITVKEFLRELLRTFAERIGPRILEMYEKSGILWNDLLNQVSNDLALYERNREYSIVLRDLTLRSEVVDWFSKLRTVVNTGLGLNSILLTAPDNQWAKEEVKRQVDRLRELKTEARRLLDKLG